MKKNTVENTALTASENPLRTLVQTMGDGGIERMEERGTKQLTESSVLPTDGLVEKHTRGTPHAEWAAKCGIKILDVVEGDSVFVNVELPEGWKQERTDHGMHNSLVDEQGRKRASIFYKAAFYDRSAHIHPVRRFAPGLEYHNDGRPRFAVVKDCGVIVWQGADLNPEENEWVASDNARAEAVAWVSEHHPEWEDVNAYWDAP